VILGAAFGVVPSARADEVQTSTGSDARALYEEGARLFDVGQYADAIDRFQRAYLVTGAPALLLNIAQAHRLNGECTRALTTYRRYLQRLPDTPHRGEVEHRITEMDQCVKQDEAEASALIKPAMPSENASHPVEAARASTDGVERAPAGPWRTVGWIGLGVAGVGALVGVTAFALTLDAQKTLERGCFEDGACPQALESDLRSYDIGRAVTIASGVTVGTAGLVALLGFLLSRADAGGKAPAMGRKTIAPFIGPWAVGVSGVF